jgi:cobalt-zinc-cadmium efflux system membrane fusion protein
MYITLYSALVFSCGNQSKEETPDVEIMSEQTVTLNAEQRANADLEISEPVSKKGYSHITVKGQMELPPENKISINFPMGGFVKKTTLLNGAGVQKGEVLAVIEDASFVQLQQDYLIGKNKLIQLQGELERQEDLNRTQASSKKQLEIARMERDNQLISLRAIEEKLKLIGLQPEKITPENITASVSVLSPVNGFITQVFVNVGKYISANQPIAELVDPSDIHLTLRVFEKDLEHVKIGQPVKAYTNGNPGRIYTGRIILIGKSFMPDKTVEIHCHLDSYHPELIPGLFMNGEIEIESSEAVAVPINSVMSESGKNYVFIVKGPNEFELIPVNISWKSDTEMGITHPDGSAVKEKIVTRNAYTLYMQLRNKAD